MRKTIQSGILLGLLGISLPLGAQNKGAWVEADPTAVVSPVSEVERLAVVHLGEGEDWYQDLRNIRTIHVPGVDVTKDQYKLAKAEANRLALEQGPLGVGNKASGTLAAQPTLVQVFYGNPYDGGIPNDNGLAVSKNGYVISVANSSLRAYNTAVSTSPIKSSSLASFGGSTAGSASKYDPKVTYDPNNDRFIVVFLNGFTAATSKVVVCASQTEDPSGAWNIYAFNGNVTGNVWTDFPQIGISNDELFVTGNLFTDAGNGQGSVIFQIELADLYAGTTATSRSFSTSYFSLHPVQGGITTYGPNFYILRNVSSPIGSSKSFYVHQITNTIANNGVLASPVSLQANVSYSVPPDATQKGATHKLNTNECRIQSSYFENNLIECAFNTGFNSRPSIYHATIDISGGLAFASVNGQYISIDSLHIAYPGIAYGGCNNGGNSSLISFNFASANHYPGNGAVYIDTDGSISAPTMCKYGFTYMGDGSDDPWRWGDYGDAAERMNAPGEIWMGASVGMGSSSHQNATYISHLTTACYNGVSNTPATPSDATMEVFPNPTTDLVTFDFDVAEWGIYQVSIFDLQGREVKNLITDRLKPGRARLKFNAAYLTAGTYLVVVKGDQGVLFQEKLVVNH